VKEKINSLFAVLREKRKIQILNPESFEDKFSLTLSRLGYIVFLFMLIITICVITFFVISYSPLRKLIPGYPDIDNVDDIMLVDQKNEKSINQLLDQSKNRDLWINNLKNILLNNDSVLLKEVVELKKLDSNYKKPIFERVIEDSLLRIKVEQEEELLLNNQFEGLLSKGKFIMPLESKTGNYSQDSNNLVTVKCDSGSNIFNVLEGNVFYLNQTDIVVNHGNGIQTVYRGVSPGNVVIGKSISRGSKLAVCNDTTFVFECWFGDKRMNINKFIK